MAPMRDLWLRWKMLKLPWRKEFLIGQDLSGNTFWEFKDALHSGRLRRIVRFRNKVYHSDVNISPQWHQWLRRTRDEPPTIQEQRGDLVRQAQLKQNALLADEKWNSKKRYIDQPKRVATKEDAGNATGERGGDKTQATDSPKNEAKNPWAQSDAGSNPGSKWQPQAWVPGQAKT